MPRYKLTIEYDGTGFVGWQMQAADVSVQGVLCKAVEHINGSPSPVQGAGRTDSGVHATGQVAHVDMVRAWDPFLLVNALNAMVRPHLVSVVAAEEVTADFHARFSATRRHYLYRILNRRAPPSLDVDQVWHVPVTLDADQMHEAAQGLVGHHDFTTFRAAQCQATSPLRTLDRLDVMRFGDFIEVHTNSRSFLHNQVRSMVGSLKMVGEGKWQPGDVRRALDRKDRTACGQVAPPEGLYLVKVDY
jgi:tRNA pseudouridine38-40 synthase